MTNPFKNRFRFPLRFSLKDFFIALGCLLVVVFGVMGTIIVYPFPRTATDISNQYINLLPDETPGLGLTAGTYTQVLPYHGSNRTFLVHLPPVTSAQNPLPLVLAFHGAGETAEIMAGRGFNAKADQAGFIVVYPDGTNATGNPADGFTFNAHFCCGYAYHSGVDDVGFISALLDRLEAVYPVDAGRVYATGFSNGGMLSYLLAMRLGDRIAAIAPVSAEYRASDTPQTPVAVFSMHGLEDNVVAYDNDVRENAAWAEFNGCGSAPISQDNSDVSRKTFCAGSPGREVVFYTVKVGVHEWFGSLKSPDGLDTTGIDLIWSFFATRSKS